MTEIEHPCSAAGCAEPGIINIGQDGQDIWLCPPARRRVDKCSRERRAHERGGRDG